MSQILDSISIILNIFFITHFLLLILEKSTCFKKKHLSSARQRVNKHISERKELIRELRKRHNPPKDKKIIYGFPWWPWFK